jgi:transposase-like protein
MEDCPKTQIDFEKRFSTEAACRDYLFSIRWPNGFQCPRCKHDKAWPLSELHYQCSNCNYQVSVIAGTIFHSTNKPLTVWFRTIWWITGQKNGVSALGLKRILGLGSYRTAWSWLHKLRRAMVTPGRDLLAGVVEVDESYFGGQKQGKRGRGAANKTLVLIAVEIKNSRIGRIRLQVIEDASAQSIENAITKNIAKGSLIQTDGWPSYNNLSSIGYKHKIIRTGESELGQNVLPHCHTVVSLIKRWLLGTHQGGVRHKNLAYYLDEFTFRFNRRYSKHRGKLFFRLIENAVNVQPMEKSK